MLAWNRVTKRKMGHAICTGMESNYQMKNGTCHLRMNPNSGSFLDPLATSTRPCYQGCSANRPSGANALGVVGVPVPDALETLASEIKIQAAIRPSGRRKFSDRCDQNGYRYG